MTATAHVPHLFHTLPTEVLARRYHAPEPDRDYAGNADALIAWLSEQGIPARIDPAGNGVRIGAVTIPPDHWAVLDGTGAVQVMDHESFAASHDNGGVSELERLKPGELADRLFEADLRVHRAAPVVALVSHTDTSIFSSDGWGDEDPGMEDFWGTPAVLEMLQSSSDITPEKFERAWKACLGERPDSEDGADHDPEDEDDDRLDAEPAREDFQRLLAHHGWGWLVEVWWSTNRAWKGSVMCGWGVRGQQVFWAPTFYGALEKAMDAIQAEYEAARAEADAYRAEHEKP